MAVESRLLDCPYCNSVEGDDVEVRASGHFFQVHCFCGVAGPRAQSEAEAIRMWNVLPRNPLVN